MSRVWPRVAGLGAGWRKYPPRGPPGPCGAFVGRFPVGQFHQECQDSRCRIFKQEERPGAVDGPRVISPRPAMPVVSRDFGIFVQKMVRRRFWALFPGYGAVRRKNAVFPGDFTVPKTSSVKKGGVYHPKPGARKKGGQTAFPALDQAIHFSADRQAVCGG